MATSNHLLQRGVQHHLAGNFAAAKTAYQQLLVKSPNHPDGLHLLGLCEFQSGRPDLAEPLIRQAIAAAPRTAPFHSNLGSVLAARGQPLQAMECHRTSVELDPTHLDGWRNLGNLASQLNDHPVAAQAFSTVTRLTNGQDGQALGYLGLSLAVLCDWDNLALTAQSVLAHNFQQANPVPPFSTLIYEFSPQQQRVIAECAAQVYHDGALQTSRGEKLPPRPLPAQRPQRLKIGYLSDDFQAHAVGYLVLGLLEAHDHTRFDIHLYSYGAPDDGAERQRIQAAADHFIDIAPLPLAVCAQRIHQDQIDILIDLKGHTGIPRAAILTWRPAPIQAAWLGYPGTFGGEDVDYIIADEYVIPAGQEEHYSEKVVRLPQCYQSNDPRRPFAATPPARADVGLPPGAFVFGALNNTFKITAAMFQVWMDLLLDCPGAVLWLLDHHPQTTANLQAAAKAAGVDPKRLVFAPRASQTDHLHRLSACDVALDTYPYGGHTTTSDFLWAGVPVITMVGQTFASRVAGSLLHAVGLPELIAPNYGQYRTLALELFDDRAKLQGLKTHLAAARTQAPLFDAERFARAFERALDDIYAQAAARPA